MKNIFCLLAIVIFFYSCTSEKEKLLKEKRRVIEQEKENIKLKKRKEIERLTWQYKTKCLWDTLSYEYSIQYKSFIGNGFYLIDNFEIHDLFEKDSTIYTLIKVGYLKRIMKLFWLHRLVLCEK